MVDFTYDNSLDVIQAKILQNSPSSGSVLKLKGLSNTTGQHASSCGLLSIDLSRTVPQSSGAISINRVARPMHVSWKRLCMVPS